MVEKWSLQGATEMFRLLIFGGTSEGRLLAEYCVKKKINTDISVATEYGASLLPKNANILCGRLDEEQISALMLKNRYDMVIDSTHPYAVEATRNIRSACNKIGARYVRLIRKSVVSSGLIVKDMDELVSILNESDNTVLSTLGSKSIPELTKVHNYRERLWLRVLPSEKILEQCRGFAYDTAKVIQEKGPFTVEQNIEHLKQSGVSMLITKESGEAGGYSEKVEAARICGAEIVTLARPVEQGQSFEEVIGIIEKEIQA